MRHHASSSLWLASLLLTPLCLAQTVPIIHLQGDPATDGSFVPSSVAIVAGQAIEFVADNGAYTAIQVDENYQPIVPTLYCAPRPDCAPRQQPWNDTLVFSEAGDYYFLDLNHQDTMHLHIVVESDQIFRNGFQAQGPLSILVNQPVSANEDAPEWSLDVQIDTVSDPADIVLTVESVGDLTSILLQTLELTHASDPCAYQITVRSYADMNSGPPISSPAVIRLTATNIWSGEWASKDVAIDVLPVNDAPSVTILMPTPLLHDSGASGARTVDNFVMALPGPFGEENQAVQFNVEKMDPYGVLGDIAIGADGSLHYVLTGTDGIADVTITALDNGGTDRGGVDTSAPTTFSIRVGAPPMQLWSDAFVDGGLIPTLYTCDSFIPGGISPGIYWSNVPPSTGSLVLIVQDDYIPLGLPHWVVLNLPTTTAFLQPGVDVATIPGVVSAGYDAPCPPIGDPAHAYSFNIYAMDSTFYYPPAAPPSEAYISTHDFEAQYGTHILEKKMFAGYSVR